MRNEVYQELFWKHGFVKIVKLNDANHAANYLTKYIAKDFGEQTYLRSYSCSHNLRRPREVYDAFEQHRILHGVASQLYQLSISKEYENPYTTAKVRYYELLPVAT